MSKPFETQTPCHAVYRQRIEVPFEYPVYFTRGALEPDNPSLRQAVGGREPGRRHRIYPVVDSGVADAWPRLGEDLAAYCEAHADTLELLAPPRRVPGGEGAKGDADLVVELQRELQAHRVDRQSFVLCIGGGSVLDAVGYAAATTHRGVRIVRMPTTVLAQNDSGVGVKNGVNAFGSKNFLGTFAPPFAVINDADFIATLEPRELRAGMAEAVKVALIRDYRFFTWLTRHQDRLARFEPAVMAPMIRTAAEIHMDHIAGCGDPFELGSARPLDFGHWAAHKLESLSHHRVRHGEAVAIGIALDCRYSVEVGLMEAAELEPICALLEGLGLRLWDDALAALDARETPAVLAGLEEFREHLGGELTVTLLRGVGRSIEVHEMDPERVVRALSWLQARDAARCG